MLESVKVVDDGVVGVFCPGGWGILDDTGSEGVFCPGGWGVVDVLFTDTEAAELEKYVGEVLAIGGTLALTDSVAAGTSDNAEEREWRLKNPATFQYYAWDSMNEAGEKVSEQEIPAANTVP